MSRSKPDPERHKKEKKSKGHPPRKCVYCGSHKLFPMRGAKGHHWMVCDDCGEEQ